MFAVLLWNVLPVSDADASQRSRTDLELLRQLLQGHHSVEIELTRIYGAYTGLQARDQDVCVAEIEAGVYWDVHHLLYRDLGTVSSGLLLGLQTPGISLEKAGLHRV